MGSYIQALPEWQQSICREVRDLVHDGEPINASALLAMFTQICADNRAGSWRKLKDRAAT